jgi:hypothetical protein
MIEEFEEHDGGVSDTALIGLVGSAFDEGRRGRDTQDVLARGRQLRRRKRAVPALGALGVIAVAASLAVALTGPSGTANPTAAGSGHSLTSNGAVVNVDNAAFSVHTDAKTGKVTVTIRQFNDEGELKQILAKAGIRTVFDSVTVHPNADGAVPAQPCTWTGAAPAPVGYAVDDLLATAGKHETIIIHPSKMPSGSVLAFLYVHNANDADANWVGMEVLSGEPTGCTAN